MSGLFSRFQQTYYKSVYLNFSIRVYVVLSFCFKLLWLITYYIFTSYVNIRKRKLKHIPILNYEAIFDCNFNLK
jgi:hypothetical protein